MYIIVYTYIFVKPQTLLNVKNKLSEIKRHEYKIYFALTLRTK